MELRTALERLHASGIDADQMRPFQVICLPENIFAPSGRDELFEAADALALLKRLKKAGVRCAGPLDFGLDVGVLARHSADRWLGVVWIRDNLAVPLLVGIIGSLVATQIDRSSSNKGNLPPAPPPKVHVELYLERQDQLKHLSFEGDAETLLKVIGALKEE